MPTAIHRRVDAARAGQDQTVITRLNSGWVLFGTQQFLLGYCLLIPDPVVPNLNALHGAQRVQFLADMITLGVAGEVGCVFLSSRMLWGRGCFDAW